MSVEETINIKLVIAHVDSHFLVIGHVQVFNLGNLSGVLHVGSVTTRSENNGNLGVGVDIVACNQGTRRVIDQGSHLGRDVVLFQRLFKHLRNILTLNTGSSETLGPSDQFTVVDTFLTAWIGELEIVKHDASDKQYVIFGKLWALSELTVNPRGRWASSSVLPKLSVMKLPKHSAQKSKLEYRDER